MPRLKKAGGAKLNNSGGGQVPIFTTWDEKVLDKVFISVTGII
jgi:hypothetical protein